MSTELESLIHRYLDGTISAEEMTQLNARLRTEAEARRELAELLNLDSALAATAAGWVPENVEPSIAGLASRKLIAFPAAVRWLAAAACVILLAGGGWWWQAQRVFATVAKGAGVEEMSKGAKLHSETRELKAGTVELITARGARVVIEAPAE
ncbi:MAG: hypothetical protein HZA89_15670, partial [Verrucomicrobia bacterium]|nr:hypothetical protein [Verrucomicrobiota bacterium]